MRGNFGLSASMQLARTACSSTRGGHGPAPGWRARPPGTGRSRFASGARSRAASASPGPVSKEVTSIACERDLLILRKNRFAAAESLP